MSTRNSIVLPSGIVSTLQGPRSTENHHDNPKNENFDLIGVAERQAKTRSLNLHWRRHDGESSSQQLASFNENADSDLWQTPNDPSLQSRLGDRLQRSATINLGGLGRSRVSSLNRPANPRLSLPAKAAAATALSKTRAPYRINTSNPSQCLHEKCPWDQDSAPISAVPPVYLGRSHSERSAGCQPEARFRPLQKGPSEGLIDPTTDTDNRRSVVEQVGKIKGTVTQALRRSSIHSIYDKAKIRQIQLQRSTIAQLTFQYAFYLLILATIYFLFVGFPLWKGLVLTILFLFQTKLVVPAGTAIFLGIGFL